LEAKNFAPWFPLFAPVKPLKFPISDYENEDDDEDDFDCGLLRS